METAYMGIDPGLTGAVAIWTASNRCHVSDFQSVFIAMNVLKGWKSNFEILHCSIEDPPYISKGKFGLGKLHRNFGQWEGLLTALRIPFKPVSPTTWKRIIPKFSKYGVKQRSLDAVDVLMPGASNHVKRKKDHNRAEALLLAYYAKEVYKLEQMRIQ